MIVDENNYQEGTDLNTKTIILETDEEEEDCKAQSDYTDNENPTNLLPRKRKV